jgi:hypothetical protein
MTTAEQWDAVNPSTAGKRSIAFVRRVQGDAVRGIAEILIQEIESMPTVDQVSGEQSKRLNVERLAQTAWLKTTIEAAAQKIEEGHL